MIDEFIIFERGGSVLWRRSFVVLRGDPIATLIRDVLLEERASDTELITSSYGVRWALANEFHVVVAVVYQHLLPPAYAPDLLQLTRDAFVSQFAAPLAAGELDETDFSTFTTVFDGLLRDAEHLSLSRAHEARNKRAPKSKPDPQTKVPEEEEEIKHVETQPEIEIQSAEDVVKRNREAFIRRRTAGAKKKTKSSAAQDSSGDHPKRGKVLRPPNKNTADEMAGLDHSANTAQGAGEDVSLARFRQQFIEAAPNSNYDVIDASSEDDDAEPNQGTQAAGKKSRTLDGSVFNFFRGLAGLRSLTRTDLDPALAQFREALISKNVAQDIADRLIESVGASLEGKQMETMTSVSTTVRSALDEALTRILTPRQSTDILADIAAKKGSGRPYVITYCGVNGVGKSTSLAKTCYYLLNHGHKVMIAACDTFRAGAVEQLRTHVRCLGKGVELFDRGYGKDAAAVANDAIRKAKELGYDVVLVDTAGRMQDNEPLMRALAKLVEVNRPDRLFFVGEALVGNDAVDQLKKFNAALSDNQTSARPRLIDGIVLTKFDTIDDKVGAAVSMVYTTGQPIVFVGVGQTYMDLRKMNTKALVRALLR